MRIDFIVPGLAVPKGSMRAMENPQTGATYMAPSSKKLPLWTAKVMQMAMDAWHSPPAEGAFCICLQFLRKRPRSHYRTGRNAHLLKANAPDYPISKRQWDIDKLVRAVLDALTGVVWFDDAQVAQCVTTKAFSLQDQTRITIYKSLLPPFVLPEGEHRAEQ